MLDRYVIDNDGLLYRVDLPRDKKLAKLKPVVRRLCVPRCFRLEIIKYAHDVTEFCKTCEACQRTKVNFGHRDAPLNPVAPPDSIGVKFCMDHKTLTRMTTEGCNAVLVMVECFSGFPHLIPVADVMALTTARAIVRPIIPWWGQISCLYSYKGPGFVLLLFHHINDFLGIKQVTSGSRTA